MRSPVSSEFSPFESGLRAAGAHDPSIAVNDLAAAYQPRRVWAAAVSIGWNLLLATLFLGDHGAGRLQRWLGHFASAGPHAGWAVPAFCAIFFAGYAVLNYPVELWFGYLEERQFALAKDGVRAWTRDWLAGTAQHGLLFVTGASLVVGLQRALPSTWVLAVAGAMLALFLITSYLAVDLLPSALFHLESLDDAALARLRELAAPLPLPRVIVFGYPGLRDFAGGLLGLGNRQALLISRSTLAGASESVMRFVLRHEMGHRRYHHLLLSTLAGWAWVAIGLMVSDEVIARAAPRALGEPAYVAWMALVFSAWMAAGEPLLAYLGRRLEYQADRFYLMSGGTVAEMQTALEELSRRNLARTEGLRRRHTMFHPLPSVWNRLHAANVFLEKQRGRA